MVVAWTGLRTLLVVVTGDWWHPSRQEQEDRDHSRSYNGVSESESDRDGTPQSAGSSDSDNTGLDIILWGHELIAKFIIMTGSTLLLWILQGE